MHAQLSKSVCQQKCYNIFDYFIALSLAETEITLLRFSPLILMRGCNLETQFIIKQMVSRLAENTRNIFPAKCFTARKTNDFWIVLT